MSFYNTFNGIQIFVVESGHEMYDDITDTTHIVEDGNVVRNGYESIFMTQHDYDILKEKIDEQNPKES